jgi:hypothetical protein
MELIDIADETATVVITRDDALILLGAIGEALEAVEDWEFQTRTGYEKQDALTVRATLKEVVARLPQPTN